MIDPNLIALLISEDPDAHIIPIATVNQKYNYDCGPAAVRSITQYFGISITQDELIKLCETGKKKGTHPDDLIGCIDNLGLKYKVMQSMTVKELIYNISKNRPVICNIQAWGDNYDALKDGHYVVAIGVNTKKRLIYFEDPWLDGARGRLSYSALNKRWRDKESFNGQIHDHLGVVIFGQGKHPDYKTNSKRIS